MLITQMYPLLADELIKAAELQFDLNQLFTTINTLDKDNLSRPGSVFAWGSTKLDELIDPDGVWNDSNDLQVAVTKGYMKNAIVSAVASYFPAASGVWHKHDNKALLDSMSGVSGSNRCVIVNTTGDSYTITPDEKDALDAASAPSGANPIATMADLPSSFDDAARMFVDAYNAVLGNGSDLDTANIATSSYGLFKGRVEAGLVTNPAVTGQFGAFDFNVIRESNGDLYFECLEMHGNKNYGANIDVPYPFTSLDFANTVESTRNIWGPMAPGNNLPRLAGPLVDATPVLVGYVGDTLNYSGIYIVRSGSNFFFRLNNGIGGNAVAKISVFGFKR